MGLLIVLSVDGGMCRFSSMFMLLVGMSLLTPTVMTMMGLIIHRWPLIASIKRSYLYVLLIMACTFVKVNLVIWLVKYHTTIVGISGPGLFNDYCSE